MALTEDEWDQTEQGQIAENSIRFFHSLAMVHSGGIAGSLLPRGLRWLVRQLSEHPQLRPPNREWKPEFDTFLSRLDPDHQDSLRNALAVIGAWSSVEACLEDICKVLVREDPTLLAGTKYDGQAFREKNPRADADEIWNNQWIRIQQKAPSSDATACERLEGILAVVERSDDVPPVIFDEVNMAHAVRNVWAHNAGIADGKFLERAPSSGIPLGTLVRVSPEAAARMIAALMTYVMIVINRERKVHGLPPIENPGRPGETDIGQAYHGLYTDRT